MDFRLIPERELDDWLKNCPDCLLVDLRPTKDYEKWHIPRAISIPYEEGMEWDLPFDREIILYCERGASSMAAARELVDRGYAAATVVGGVRGYRK